MAFEALSAKITGDSSSFVRSIGQAEAATKSLESQSQSVKNAVGAMGAGLAAVSAGGLAAATVAAARFETSLVELEKVTSGDFAASFKDDILEMSRTIPLAASSIADLAAQAGRFGVAEEHVRGFVEATAKMAQATDLSATRAGEAFAKLAQLTGTPIPQIENLGSAINELSNNFATSSSEIVDSMLRSSAALSQLGVSNTDIAGLSAALNSVSESSERAGSRLRRLAQEIAVPKDKITEMAAGIGVTVDQFKNMRENDPTGLIRMMAASMANGGEQARLLGEAFSTTSRQALAGLGQALTQTDTALKMSAKAFKENTSLQREFEAASQTAAAQFQLLKNAIMEVAIQTGSVLLPYVTQAIKAIREWVNAFAELNASTGGVAGVLAGLIGIVSGLSAAFIAFYPQIQAVSPALSLVAKSALSVLAPAALLTSAILGLAAAFESNFAGIRTQTVAVLGALQSEFTKTAQLLKTIFGPAFQAAAQAATDFATRVESALRPVIAFIGSQLVAGIQQAGVQIRAGLVVAAGHFNTFATQAQTALAQLQPIFAAAATYVTQFATNVQARLAQLQPIIAQASGYFQQFVAQVRAHLAAVGPVITQAAGFFVQFAAQAQTALTQLQGVVSVVIGAVSTRLRTLSSVLPPLTQLWDEHKTAVQAAATVILAAVGGIIPTLLTFAAQTESVTQTLGGLANTIMSAVRPAFQAALVPAVGAAAVAFRGQLIGAVTAAVTSLGGLIASIPTVNTALITLQGLAQATGRFLQVALSAGLATATTKVVALAGAIGSKIPILNRFTGIIGTAASILRTQLVVAVGSAAARIAPLIARFGSLGVAVASLSNPITLIIGLVAGLAAAWTTNFMGIRDATQQVLTAVKAAINGDMTQIRTLVGTGAQSSVTEWTARIQGFITEAQRVFGILQTVIFDALQWIYTNAVQPVLRSIIQAWEQHGTQIMDSVGQLMTFLKNAIKVGVGVLITLWNMFGDEILAVTKFIFDTIGSVINTALDVILTGFDIFTDLLVGDWESAGQKFLDYTVRIFTGILNFIAKWVGGFIGWFDTTFIQPFIQFFVDLYNEIIGNSLIPDLFNDILTFITGWIPKFIAVIAEWLGQTLTDIQEWITTTLDSFIQWGADLLAEIGETLTTIYDRLVTWATNTLEHIQTWITNTFEAFVQWATDVWEAFDTWATDTFDRIVTWATDTLDRIVTWAADTYQSIQTWITDTFDAFVQWATDVYDRFATWATDVYDRLVTWATNTLEHIQTWITDTFEAFVQWATDVWEEFDTWATNVYDRIVTWAEDTLERIQTWISNVIEDIEQFATDFFDEIEQLATDVYDEIQQLAEDFLSEIKQLVDDVITEAERLYDDVKKWVDNMIEDTIKAVKNWDLSREVGKIVDSAIKEAERIYSAVVGSSIIPDTVEDSNEVIRRWDLDDHVASTVRDANSAAARFDGVAPGEASVGRGGGPTNVTYDVTIEGDADRSTIRKALREFEKRQERRNLREVRRKAPGKSI